MCTGLAWNNTKTMTFYHLTFRFNLRLEIGKGLGYILIVSSLSEILEI